LVLRLIARLQEAMKFGVIKKPTDTRLFPTTRMDMPEGTRRAILKEAGMDPNDFLKKK
jgi:hypothetical protein